MSAGRSVSTSPSRCGARAARIEPVLPASASGSDLRALRLASPGNRAPNGRRQAPSQHEPSHQRASAPAASAVATRWPAGACRGQPSAVVDPVLAPRREPLVVRDQHRPQPRPLELGHAAEIALGPGQRQVRHPQPAVPRPRWQGLDRRRGRTGAERCDRHGRPLELVFGYCTSNSSSRVRQFPAPRPLIRSSESANALVRGLFATDVAEVAPVTIRYAEGVEEYGARVAEGELLTWCVVANVLAETTHGEGGEDVQRGLKHFAPGAKVWVLPPQWGDGGESVVVAGRHRGRATAGSPRMVVGRQPARGCSEPSPSSRAGGRCPMS